jgi:hypothetical protein
MAIDLAKFEKVATAERQDVDFLRKKAADTAKDVKGSSANNFAASLRLIAVADYVIGRDVGRFRSGLSEAAKQRNTLFSRFDSGEGVSPSYVSMISYKALLSALASGDEPLSKALAEKMGGRTSIEKEYDRPFDIAFGYALKHIVLSDLAAAAQWVDALEIACKDAENADFAGYAKVLRAILSANQADANTGLAQVVDGHKRQCIGKGLFKDTEDELLCVWGIAIANLARMRGVAVEPIAPLIPADLLR